MKRILLLLVIGLVLVACSSTMSSETAVTVPAKSTEQPAAQAAPGSAANSAASPGFPATTVAEASVLRDRDWTVGATEPLVAIIEYGDFQCPGCAGIAPVLARLVDAYPDQVQLTFRHFPLTSIHPNAQKAAEASEAAGAQGAFWPYHDLLFAQASKWSSLDAAAAQDYFIGLAKDLNLDTDRFAQELADGVHADYVSGLEQEAKNIGLPGTPTGIINGRAVEGLPPTYEVWAGFVEETIAAESAMSGLADMQFDAPPEMALKDGVNYSARVTMANGGEFVIELYPDSAPQTVNSFIFLANEGWFDGVSFHRVLPGFVAQTGDPTGTGMGGPGYTIPNEIDPTLSHAEKGMVAMANSGPDTNGSQWYITLDDVSQLDGSYTIFGKVIEGMDVVEAITPRDPSVDPNAPVGDIIKSIVIEEN